MTGARGRVVPLLIVAAAGAAAVGVAALVDRFAAIRDTTPAPPGTPQVGSRLPIALWPADGTEPIVTHDLRGWRELAAAIYHRDTTIDDAARARAVVIAQFPRRAQDARREIALEAHVLRGGYDPAPIAAAWLHPLTPGMSIDDLAAFGIGSVALDTLRACARIDTEPELEHMWRREFGVDVVRPQITSDMVAETPADRRGMLWALLLSLAAERVEARHLLTNPPRG
jgi:hypothetical protein